MDFDEQSAQSLLNDLSLLHRAPDAYRRLLARGFAAVPFALAGLRHPNAAVRERCCAFLDHYFVPEALSELLALLHDPDPKVRITALHTLACDRCKEGECRPQEAETLPPALRLLREDGDAHVRAMAVEVVGLYVHTNPIAERALIEATTGDASSTVRKKARWYAPGGPIFRRTMPRPLRARRT